MFPSHVEPMPSCPGKTPPGPHVDMLAGYEVQSTGVQNIRAQSVESKVYIPKLYLADQCIFWVFN